MQIKNIIIMITLLAVISIAACKCNPGQQPPVAGGDTTAVAYVYTFEKTPDIKTDDTKKLINQFLGDQKATDLTVSKDENIAYYVSPDDVNTTFEQDLGNGNFAFSKINKSYLGDLKPQLPSATDAENLGQKFLQDNKLAPQNKNEFKLLHTGGLRAQGVKGPIIDKTITLSYGREIDSIPVVGPGSKIIINIGDKGEIVGLDRRWRELNRSGRKAVTAAAAITLEEAQAQAKRQIAQEFGQAATFDTRSSGKAYYDNNGGILQPVWVFETVVNLHDPKDDVAPLKYLCVIPLLKDSPEPLNFTKVDARAKANLQTIDRGKIDTTKRNNDRKTRD